MLLAYRSPDSPSRYTFADTLSHLGSSFRARTSGEKAVVFDDGSKKTREISKQVPSELIGRKEQECITRYTPGRPLPIRSRYTSADAPLPVDLPSTPPYYPHPHAPATPPPPLPCSPHTTLRCHPLPCIIGHASDTDALAALVGRTFPRGPPPWHRPKDTLLDRTDRTACGPLKVP
jgi:hypothetical protein